MNRLSAKFCQNAPAGYHADGGGLYLLVTAEGTASWVYRYRAPRQSGQKAGRLREMGLGSARLYSLADARQRALEAARLRADGIDPIDSRRALRGAQKRLWGDAVKEYIEAHKASWKSDAQADQWTQSLADYGPAADMAVEEVTTDVVLACLRPIWTTKTETATRVRGRIERVWAAERFAKVVTGENPALWRGHLEHALPKPGKVAKPKHHAAMPWAEAPAAYRELAGKDALSAKALRFTVLTVARTEETLGADWPEFDLKRKLWTIPAERMKGGIEHVVPLPPAAVAILESLPRDKPPFAMSENAMLYYLQRKPPKGIGRPYTVHGLRSTFYDWVRDHGHAPDHVADAALAHAIKDEVKAAYGRSKLLALRRDLMALWADYLSK